MPKSAANPPAHTHPFLVLMVLKVTSLPPSRAGRGERGADCQRRCIDGWRGGRRAAPANHQQVVGDAVLGVHDPDLGPAVRVVRDRALALDAVDEDHLGRLDAVRLVRVRVRVGVRVGAKVGIKGWSWGKG